MNLHTESRLPRPGDPEEALEKEGLEALFAMIVAVTGRGDSAISKTKTQVMSGYMRAAKVEGDHLREIQNCLDRLIDLAPTPAHAAIDILTLMEDRVRQLEQIALDLKREAGGR
jgi:hypothetical protein